MNLEWNVYYEDFNNRTVIPWNIFRHSTFRDEVTKLLKDKNMTRDEFEEALKRKAKWCFWSKSQYEVVLTSFPPYILPEELKRLKGEDDGKIRYHVNPEIGEKVDIYDQLELNWDVFVDYVYSHRKADKNG